MIGGEFSIPFTDFFKAPSLSRVEEETYHYASGRAALYQILKYLKFEKCVRRVLLPDYLCSSVLVPIKRLQLDFEFYPIDEALELEEKAFAALYRTGTAILVINYFGLKDLTKQIAFIRNFDKDAFIIEDDVQAYYEFKKPLGDVDFKYTSLRKTFAIPDGGLVKTNHPLPVFDCPSTFGQYKAVAALMKSIREGNFDDSVYLDISKIGSSKIDDELDFSMSFISERLYASTDDEEVKKRRQYNAKYLVNKLSERYLQFILPVKEEKVPLFVPIYLNDRDEVRKRMFQHEVFCPVHWQFEGMPMKKGKEMADHELSLIVDQRYNEKDMDLIISLL